MPNIFDKTTARVLATVLLFAAILAVLYLARKTFIVFLFAIFFAYLLQPVVERLQRSGKRSRGRAILVTYVGLIVVVVALLTIFGPPVATEGQKLAQSVPRLMENFNSGRFVIALGERRGWSTETETQIQQFISEHQGDIVLAAQSFAKKSAEVATNAPWLVLIPILAIFFLKDKESFLSSLAQTADRGEQSFVRRILKDVDVMLARYIRAQLVIAALALVAYTLFLNVMRVPYAFAIGAVGGVLEFIPVIGPAITAVLIVGVSFLSGYQHVIVLLIFVGVWRMIQDYVTAPRLFGSGLELHPLASIFAVLVGGEVAGVVGMFLSVPVMAALRIVWRNWRQHEAAEEIVRPRAV
jgi:predicted PurR-regulated permease PerM